MNDSDRSTEITDSGERFKAYLKFARQTAHDLNNTLFPILTGAELILEEVTDNESVSDTASDIKESSDRAIKILKAFINETKSLDSKNFIR